MLVGVPSLFSAWLPLLQSQFAVLLPCQTPFALPQNIALCSPLYRTLCESNYFRTQNATVFYPVMPYEPCSSYGYFAEMLPVFCGVKTLSPTLSLDRRTTIKNLAKAIGTSSKTVHRLMPSPRCEQKLGFVVTCHQACIAYHGLTTRSWGWGREGVERACRWVMATPRAVMQHLAIPSCPLDEALRQELTLALGDKYVYKRYPD